MVGADVREDELLQSPPQAHFRQIDAKALPQNTLQIDAAPAHDAVTQRLPVHAADPRRLGPVHRIMNRRQRQQPLLFVFEACLEMDAIGPDVDVALR
jgi:hypothetical protein